MDSGRLKTREVDQALVDTKGGGSNNKDVKATLLKIITLSALILLMSPDQAEAQGSSNYRPSGGGREFMLSCSYGVLAGTLVGAASLAFEDQPGDKLYRIARGASLGLYTGIFLGLYVVYVVPKQMERMQERRLRDSLGFGITPTFDPQSYKMDGASLQMSLVSW